MIMQGPVLSTSTTMLESYQLEVLQLLDANLDEQSFSEALSQKLATQKLTSEHLLFIAEMIEQYFVRHKEGFPLKGVEVVNAFLVNLSYEALIEQLPGAHAGKSGLWLLADAASRGKPEAFLTVWKNLAGNIPAEVLLREAQQGRDKGITALWLLADAAGNGKPEVFLAVWEKLGRDIPAEALWQEAQQGLMKGITALWWLARAAAKGRPEAFLAVWEKLGGNIPAEALWQEAQQGEMKGINALWWLACAAANDKPEAFLAVWEKFKGNIPAEALLKEAQQGSDKGINALWFLACAAADGKPVAFLAVWERVKKVISLTDLLKVAQQGLDAGKDALGWLVRGALEICPPTTPLGQRRAMEKNASKNLQVVKDALRQLPGALPAAALQQDNLLYILLRRNDRMRKNYLVQEESLLALSRARNSFFLALDAYKHTNNKKNEATVREAAKKALEAGYLNAFYDLGNHYFAIGEIESGFAAYEKVPANSWQYDWVVKQLCAHHIKKITISPAEEKLQHLKAALDYALKITGRIREQYIKKLAAQYLLNFNLPMDVPQDLVPSDWLARMNSAISVEMGLKHLDELKTSRALEKEKQARQEQLAQEKPQHLWEKEVLARENAQLQQAQAQPVESMPEVAFQSQFLPQFSDVAEGGGGKRLREAAAPDAIRLEKLPVDSTSAGEDERLPKRMRFGNPTH